MPALPDFSAKTKENKSPHVVILGAGASRAAFPFGDATGKKIPLLTDLIELLGLEKLLNSSGIPFDKNNFESTYSMLHKDDKYDALRNELETRVSEYFRSLQMPENIANLYDLLVLSLREKDLVATFNWDPFLAQAIKRNRHLGHLPQVLFLHGNVEVAYCIEHKRKGFLDNRCTSCDRKFGDIVRTPLLYPVGEKDYTADPLIKNEWDVLQRALEDAYFITVFGYRAPISDTEARKLMHNAFLKNPTRELAQIEIIDIAPKADVEENWADFLADTHYGVIDHFNRSYISYHPRRSCDAFAQATLQQDPWQDNKIPDFATLSEAQSWFSRLIEEEKMLKAGTATCLSSSPVF